MGTAIFIALRHLVTRLRASILNAAGVAVGVLVMCVMGSMLLGLQRQFIDSALKATPNVLIEGEQVGVARRITAVPTDDRTLVALSRRPPPEARDTIRNYRQVLHLLLAQPEVSGAAPQLTGQVLVGYGARVQPATLIGIDPSAQARVLDWEANLREPVSSLETSPNGVILGIALAEDLGIRSGSQVSLITGPASRRRARVVALYQSGIRQLDETVCYVNLNLAQTLLDRSSEVSTIAVRLTGNVNGAPAAARRIESVTGLRALSWQESNAVYFSIFTLQQTMTSVMIAFVVLIAGFGITNGLITLILEKQRDIGILKALGMTNSGIAVTFLLEGASMGLFGAIVGMLLASVAIAYMDNLPLRGEGELTTSTTFTMLRGPLIYLIPAGIAVVVSVIASLWPVRRATRYDPVEIIRSAK